MNNQPSYTTIAELEAGYAKHDAMKRECGSLARMCARHLDAGTPTVAEFYAAKFVALDDERFEFLMALSEANRAFAAAVV